MLFISHNKDSVISRPLKMEFLHLYFPVGFFQVIEFDDGSGSVLRIQPLRTHRDEAIYECTATNSAGEINTSAKLTVLEGKISLLLFPLGFFLHTCFHCGPFFLLLVVFKSFMSIYKEIGVFALIIHTYEIGGIPGIALAKEEQQYLNLQG